MTASMAPRPDSGDSQSASQFASCECGACESAPRRERAKGERGSALEPPAGGAFGLFVLPGRARRVTSAGQKDGALSHGSSSGGVSEVGSIARAEVFCHSLALRFAVGVHGKVGGDRFAERLRVDASYESESGSSAAARSARRDGTRPKRPSGWESRSRVLRAGRRARTGERVVFTCAACNT